MSSERKVSIEDPTGSSLSEPVVDVDNIEAISENEDLISPGDEDVEIQFEVTEINDEDITQDTTVQIEDLDDEEQIWEDGPTAGMIKAWKQQHGDVYITSVSFDKHVVWRTLNRLEYKQIVKKMEQMVQAGQLSSAEANMWNEETIAEVCMLFPQLDREGMSSLMAGLPSLIAQEVLEASGFVALEVRQL